MSNYRIYAGNKKALVFPIMGDGYVHLDYSKHIPQGPDGAAYSEATHGIEIDEGADDDDAKYGLWSLADSFTMEGIITPYDVNGFGHRLITDYISGGGTPTLATKYNSASLELPLNKFYSPRGQLGTGNSSRTSAYFSHELVAYLAVDVNDSATTLTLSNIDNIMGGTNIRIGNEQMEVVSISTSKTIVVARAQNGTTATAHFANAEIYGDNRINHKMTIFHNETCQFYLKNMTRTTMNQPAEYKLGCVIKGKDRHGHIRTVTVQSTVPVITANEEYFGKTVEQTESVDEVFGRPVYFGIEDVVRYHKKINTSSNQIYAERFYHNAVLVSDAGTRAVFGDLLSGDGNKIGLQGTTWAAGLSTGDYIKVIGSGNNDGHYKVKEKLTTTEIEVEPFTSGVSVFANESVAFASNVLAIHFQTRHYQLSFNDGAAAYYKYDSTDIEDGSGGNPLNLDMSPHIWKGCNLYAQSSSTGIHSTSLEHGKQPTYLGYIANINVNSSSNRSDVVSMAKCKLTKPIRTTTETIIHVDDASKLSIGGVLWNDTEPMVITNIEKNKITVTRGSSPKTTSLDSYGLTGATNANYLISSKEEEMFSRILYCSLPDTGFTNGLKIVDGSGNSLADSDEYGAHLLGDTWKEASYVLRPFHLAMAYDRNANRISLFLDGKELDTEIFSEGKIRYVSIAGDGSATATVTTQDNHGLATNDWIKLEGTDVIGLNGTWKVTKLTDNTFSINCITALSGGSSFSYYPLFSDGSITDVTIRTTVNFSEFELNATDCFLGSNGNDSLEVRRGSQFMGEMHEFAITRGYKDRFNSIDTLVPNFRNTLVYFRFEGDES